MALNFKPYYENVSYESVGSIIFKVLLNKIYLTCCSLLHDSVEKRSDSISGGFALKSPYGESVKRDFINTLNAKKEPTGGSKPAA